MIISFRWGGLVAAAVIAATVFGWFSVLANDDPPVSEIAQGPWREAFWFAVFAFVMTTSVWVFLRRQADRLARVAVRAKR